MVKRTEARAIEGATPAKMPGFIKPQLATLRSKAPKGPQWLHEIKYDGYRVQVYLNKGKKKVFTRNGLDWTKRFSVIAGALDRSGQAIIDGEVVVIKDGRTLDLPRASATPRLIFLAGAARDDLERVVGQWDRAGLGQFYRERLSVA